MTPPSVDAMRYYMFSVCDHHRSMPRTDNRLLE